MRTLLELLQRRAAERPEAVYCRLLHPDRTPSQLTYGELGRRTRAFAALYTERGVRKGDAVLVILPHGEDLMPAFLGAMWVGAVPAFLPWLTARLDPKRYWLTIQELVTLARPSAIVIHTELRDAWSELGGGGAEPTLLTDQDVVPDADCGDPAPHGPEDVALIQHSSGSTGLQNGAMLSHRAVLTAMAGVTEAFGLTEEDSFFSWLPLYHDWGLVCVALHTLQLGNQCTLMSPMHWIGRPVAAFEAIQEHGATVYYQPNFAFNYSAQRIRDEEMEGLDLSSLRICCNGAEPCLYESHRVFADRFARWGFDPGSLAIVYGMAEVTNSVFAAGPERDDPIRVDTIDRLFLQSDRRAAVVADDHPHALRMLGVGRPLRGTAFRIVDADLEELAERQVGEIEIRSRAAFHGYHHNPEATAECDDEGWYLTGDLGYRVGDTLFVTGRQSDLIIIGGENIYPQDAENIVAEHPAVVAGRVAAIGVEDPERGTQRMEIILESRSQDPEVLAAIDSHARTQIYLRMGVQPHRIWHAPRRWLIKTASGKIARLPNYRRIGELQPDAGDADRA